MTEKVDQAEGFQEVYHLLDLHVLKEANVCLQVSYDDRILPQ